MWMAEGFMSVEYDGEREETMEDVAERYLNELVGRCMVEVGKKGSTGRIKTCRLHDLMRDVCLSRAKEENFIHNCEMREGIWNDVPKGKMRKLFLIGNRVKTNQVSLSSYERNSQIRTLVLWYDFETYRVLEPVRLANSFELLRVLLLEGLVMLKMKYLEKEIGKLIHLRYLSLRMSWIAGHFTSLDKLGCMETLDLLVRDAEGLSRRLKVGEIWKMKHLRHLYLPDIWSLKSHGDNVQIESNPNVQTLVNFPLLSCGVAEILKFPNLRKLQIIIENMKEFNDILRKNKGFIFNRLYSLCVIIPTLKSTEKIHLDAILMRCPHPYKLKVSGPIEKFPQLKQFPNNLTKLILEAFSSEDVNHIETTVGNLPNLRTLFLSKTRFSKEQHLSFKKGTFLQLKSLVVDYLSELKNLTVEQGAMPILEHLVISNLRNLTTAPRGLRYIATLKELQVRLMSPEFAARLKEGGADFDEVKHVPSITFHFCC